MTTQLTMQTMRVLMMEVGGLSPEVSEERLRSATFEELDVDSIARLALVTRIENELGTRLDGEFENEPSPSELLTAVNEHLAAGAA